MKETEMKFLGDSENLNHNSNRIKNSKEDYSEFKPKKRKIKLIISIIIIIVIISTVLVGLYLYQCSKKEKEEKKEENEDKNYMKEDLIVKINYKMNTVYRYNLKKMIQMNVEAESIDENNSTKNIEKFTDFIFIIEKENLEKNNETLTERKWFIGYLAILNLSLNYETNETQLIYSDTLNKIINNETVDINQETEQNISFVKIEFYENGCIKNYYYQKNFPLEHMEYIKEYSNLILPKISSNLYSDSIEQSLNNINLRYLLNSEEKNINKFSNDDKKVYRILQNDNSESDFEIEEFLTPSDDISINYDFREKNNYSNITNLTEFSVQNLENKEVNLKNSIINKTIYTQINNEGILDYVKKIDNAILTQDKTEEEDINNNTLKDESNITFNIDNMLLDSITELNLISYFTYNDTIKVLLNYFNSGNYYLFNESSYEQYKSEIIIDNILKDNNLTNENISELILSDENNLRVISSISDSYYGMNKLTNEKDLYNYNFLGLKMQKKIFNELDPSTGKLSSYFNIIFGNINKKIKTSEQQSNLHIILKNKNKMAFDLIKLLKNTNIDLKEKNNDLSSIMINIENDILSLLKDYDYSNIFDECLKQVIEQLNSFTSEIFDKLIDLINVLYEKYINILDNINNETYDIFNKIRKITKEEYINYIYEMNNILENFINETLLFLEKIEKEVNILIKIEKIDFLYDILDNIYESSLILNQFNINLFKAIEKGIIKFKSDIDDYIEEIIGDLLYITDFLSVSIIKNEIIARAYDEKTLKQLSFKLKNFRNIIISILDSLVNNINEDYKYEMSNNNNSLKLYSNNKVKMFYNEINNKSNYLVDKIKGKINYFDLYEIYTSNLDFIDYINNKTMIELINDMNDLFINEINKIKPEYMKENYNDNDNIFYEKDILFNITKNITKEINNEINDINEYMEDCINKYKDENLFNIEYYLYKINYLFFDNETNFLFNELSSAFNDTIQMHKERMDYNYKLGLDYVNELHLYIYTYHAGDHLDMGKGSYLKYFRFRELYEEYIYKAVSDEVFDNLEQNYIKIKTKIFNFVKNKLSNLELLYSKIDIKKDNLDFIKKINNELYTISDKINLCFNEERFDFLKSELIFNTLKELRDYIEVYNQTFVDKFEYIIHHTDGIYDTPADYRYWWKQWTGHVKNRPNCYVPTTNNIDLVNMDISPTINYMNNMTNIIINNFIDKIDQYLSKYINSIEYLYNNLYTYIVKKINDNSNIENYFNYYEIIYDKILLFNLNLDNTYIDIDNQNNSFIYIDNLENNLNLLFDEYYNYYYLNNYNKFLEYPNEILYKINQFSYELKYNVNILKNKFNGINKNKSIDIIKSISNFIEQFITSDYKYILININKKHIIKDYFNFKYDFISSKFTSYIEKLHFTENITLEKINNDSLIFAEQNYNISIFSIFEELDNFTYNFENLINETFINDICDNKSDENNYDEREEHCKLIKYKSNLSDYEYNYNIVKLRSGLFYSKKALENIMNLFDELNYDEILNLQNYNNIVYKLNDQNFLDIYNASINKLNEINETTNSLLKEEYEYFSQEIIDYYKIDNDYYPFLKDFEKILKLENEKYNEYLIKNIDLMFDFIKPLLNEFNKTLFEQMNEYKLYYIEENNTFDELYNEYKYKINNTLSIFKNKILNLNNDIVFLNSFKKYISFEQYSKRVYYKHIINKLESRYNYKLLNMTLNIGEFIENLLIKEYEDNIFNYRYEYIQIIDLYLNNFLINITEYISIIEKNTLNKFELMYESFVEKFYNNSIDDNYLKDLRNNYTICLNYSMDLLNETLIEDETNYEQYINDLNNSTLNHSEKENIIFINKTKILLDCDENNYYNYSIKIYNKFELEYKMKLNHLINEINGINDYNLSDIILYQYIEKNFKLDNYTLTIEQIEDIYYKLFLAFDDKILYINYTQNSIYSDYMYTLLIDSFNSSYTEYISNYLISPLIENITLYINNYAEINLYYLINKIKDEFNYYLIMLNNTKELGKNSKMSLSNLYNDINNKLEQYVDSNIKEYILFYINIFYKNNKYVFKDNYINYFAKELNEYNIEIHQLKELINEIIYDGKFNETLNIYSNVLFTELIYYKLNDTINELLYNKLSEVHLIINDLNKIMNDMLYNIEINEENINIISIINNYKIILSTQNNQFKFKVSEKPFEYLYSFIKDTLEPPILEIKTEYNIIEKQILEKILNVTNNFPDFSLIIKDNLRIDDILELIKYLIEKIEFLLLKYGKDLNNEYDNYINKIIHYTYINGLESFNGPCKYSFCSIDIEQIKSQINITDQNTSIYYYSKNKYIYNNITKKLDNNKNAEKMRKLIETEDYNYDETMGAISKEDIIPFLLEIQKTIFEFNKTYINNFDINSKLKSEQFFIKVNGTYKIKLKNSILQSASKFSSILSRESYSQLIDNMLKQYFKIENYLNDMTVHLENDLNKVITILTNSSIFIKYINDISYNKILGYFDILIEMIQDKYELITKNQISNLRNLDDDFDDPEGPNEMDEKIFEQLYKKTQIKNEKIFIGFIGVNENCKIKVEGLLKDIIKNGIKNINFDIDVDDIELSAYLTLYKNKIAKIGFKQEIQKHLLNIQLPIFAIFFPSFPYLQMRIIPQLDLSLNFDLGYEINLLKKDYSIEFDVSARADVSLSLEVGFYIPGHGGLEIAISVGLKGTLGSGAIGMKLSLYINEAEYEIELYCKYNALSLSFYILFSIKVKIGFVKFSFSFYLMNKKLVKGYEGKKSVSTKLKLKKLKNLLKKFLN